MTSRARHRVRTALTVVLACCLAVAFLVPAPVVAGDGATIFSLDPDEADVDPGETVTLELVVSDHGDLHGNGIDELSATIAYESDVFDVVEVEHESMLATGNPDVEVAGSDAVDSEAGTITIEQERTPSGDGAKGTEPAAAITLSVAEDAGPTTETIDVTDASTTLVSGYPQATFERSATVHVDGGDETADESDGSDDDPEGVTLADDAGDDSNDADGDETADESETDADDETETGDESTAVSDSVPGFTVSVAVAGLVLAVWLVGRRP